MIGSHALRRWAALLVAVSLLAACGKTVPPGNTFVTYDDEVLHVDGREYRREQPSDYPILPGRVVVQPRKGEEPARLAMEWVHRYGLDVVGRSAEGWLLLKVPVGYEEQWASVFSMTNPAQVSATTDPASSPTPLAPPPTAPTAPPPGVPVPAGEPSADDVRRLVFERYQRIEDAGGLPMTMTATGQPLLIHTKVFDARKESCHRPPHAEPGVWECEAQAQMALCNGDCDPALEEPLPKGERIGVRWDPAGQWVLE